MKKFDFDFYSISKILKGYQFKESIPICHFLLNALAASVSLQGMLMAVQ